jgi:Lrp/AsnC family leucine-responsive transcriptional regulator
MTFDSEKLLDGVGRKLLALLQEDARRSYSELGRMVGLSGPAVSERVKRLEEAGIITGYHAKVNPGLLGLPIMAIVRLSGVADLADRVTELLTTLPDVIECHRVTGNDSYVIKVATVSVTTLEALIDRLLPFGEVTTAIVLSSPVTRRIIKPQL